MHYADIHALLIKADYSASRVADELNVPRPNVTNVIRGKATSHNIASYISAVLSVSMNRLWPDGRYSKPPRKQPNHQLKHKVAA